MNQSHPGAIFTFIETSLAEDHSGLYRIFIFFRGLLFHSAAFFRTGTTGVLKTRKQLYSFRSKVSP